MRLLRLVARGEPRAGGGQLGLVRHQRLDGSLDVFFLLAVDAIPALALDQAGDRRTRPEPSLLLLEVRAGTTLGLFGERERALGLGRRLPEHAALVCKVLDLGAAGRVIAVEPDERSDDLAQPGCPLRRPRQQQVPVSIVGDGRESVGDDPDVAIDARKRTRGCLVFLAGCCQGALVGREVPACCAMGQSPLAHPGRHRHRTLDGIQARTDGLHSAQGCHPGLLHLVQALWRGVGIVALQQAREHLGLSAGLRGHLVGALLDPSIDLQGQEACQDRAPFLRLAAQERVELVLGQQHDLREAVEVEPEDLLHPRVCLAHATGERLPLAVVALGFEGHCGWTSPEHDPRDPVAATVRRELEEELCPLHGRTDELPQVVAQLGCATVEGDGHGLEERRLASPGRARDREEVEPVEVDLGFLDERRVSLDSQPARPHAAPPASRSAAPRLRVLTQRFLVELGKQCGDRLRQLLPARLPVVRAQARCRVQAAALCGSIVRLAGAVCPDWRRRFGVNAPDLQRVRQDLLDAGHEPGLRAWRSQLDPQKRAAQAVGPGQQFIERAADVQETPAHA